MAYIGRSVEIGMFEKQVLTPNSSTTTFTLTFAVGAANSLLVVYGGVIQEPNVAYSVSGGGQSIVFSEAPVTGTTLYIIYLGKQFLTPRTAGQETTKQSFTGDGTTTLFTLTDPPVVPAGIMVFVDGILQREGAGGNYVSSGSTINFDGAPDNGAEIDVYTLVKEKVSIDTVADGSITRAKLAQSAPYWDAQGRVGIGLASSPLADVHVETAAFPTISIRNTSAASGFPVLNFLDNRAGGGNFQLENGRISGVLTIRDNTAAADRIRLRANGNFEVINSLSIGGNTSPRAALDISGGSNGYNTDFANGLVIGIQNESAVDNNKTYAWRNFITGNASGGQSYRIDSISRTESWTNRLTINTDGNIGINNTSPVSRIAVGSSIGSGYAMTLNNGTQYGAIIQTTESSGSANPAFWVRSVNSSNTRTQFRVQNDGYVIVGEENTDLVTRAGHLHTATKQIAAGSPYWKPQTGRSRYSFSCLCDNTWRTVFNQFNDVHGYFYFMGSDSPSQNVGMYNVSVTSPGYGVNQLNQVNYVSSWNTGSVTFQLANLGNGNMALQVRATSYYSASNTANIVMHFDVFSG